MTWKTRHVTQVGNLPIGWLEAGPAGGGDPTARPVVLVHGLGTGDLWWTPTISVLAEDRRVLAVDLAGFGRTAGQPVRLDVAADQLAAWAAAIGLEQASFVGHSMGGLVTADLAARYPDVVERLVLVDAAGLPISQHVTGHLMNFVRASPFMPASAYPIAVECVLRCGPLAIARASHQLLTMDLTKRYEWIRAPTRVLWGARDHLLPSSFGRRLAEAIPGATMVEIPDAGHSPMWENPDEFHRQLVAFLEEPVSVPARHAATTALDPTRGLAAGLAPGLAPGLTAGVPLTAPTGGRVQSRYVPIGDASVHVRVGRPDDGAAPLETPPIVFVHGYVFAGRTWQPTLERLATGHLVLAPDLTGFGWTSTTSPPLDVAGHGRALLALLDAAGIGRAVFVGTSLGSQVVAQLAVDHPDRVLGVVLVSPTFDPDEPSLPRQLLRLGADVTAEWPSVWFEHLRDLVLAGPSRVVATVRRGWEHRNDEVLPGVHVPAVVVRGSRDPLVSRSWARKAAGLLPNGRAVEVRGGPRLLGQASPAALARIVEEHVAAVAAVARPRADGTLPIHIVSAVHRRRPEARPRKTRAGPPRA
jgi:2-hydroxy-6-oxonona-2,4-dienedioate hydrolase